MNCPDISELISYALAPESEVYSDIAKHVLECPECRKNLEIVHETMLADRFVKSHIPIGLQKKAIKRIFDLVVSLSRSLKDGFQDAIKWADDFVPDFEVVPIYAHAARSLGQEKDKCTASNWSFEKLGDGCFVKIVVNLTTGGLNLQIRFFEKPMDVAVPFELSVVDADAGIVLLDKRSFLEGAAVLKGVEKGTYVVSTSASGKRCEFTLKVE